jgi:hypothetical protein
MSRHKKRTPKDSAGALLVVDKKLKEAKAINPLLNI